MRAQCAVGAVGSVVVRCARIAQGARPPTRTGTGAPQAGCARAMQAERTVGAAGAKVVGRTGRARLPCPAGVARAVAAEAWIAHAVQVTDAAVNAHRAVKAGVAGGAGRPGPAGRARTGAAQALGAHSVDVARGARRAGGAVVAAGAGGAGWTSPAGRARAAAAKALGARAVRRA